MDSQKSESHGGGGVAGGEGMEKKHKNPLMSRNRQKQYMQDALLGWNSDERHSLNWNEDTRKAEMVTNDTKMG